MILLVLTSLPSCLYLSVPLTGLILASLATAPSDMPLISLCKILQRSPGQRESQSLYKDVEDSILRGSPRLPCPIPVPCLSSPCSSHTGLPAISGKHGVIPSQGCGICWSLYLEHSSSRDPRGSLSQLPQIFVQMSPSHRGLSEQPV